MFGHRDELQRFHVLYLRFERLIEAFVVQHKERFVVLSNDAAGGSVHHLIQCAVTARKANNDIRIAANDLLALGHIRHLNQVVAVIRHTSGSNNP